MTRSLSLRGEALSALAPDDLAAVGGGAEGPTRVCPYTTPVLDCISWDPGCSVWCTG